MPEDDAGDDGAMADVGGGAGVAEEDRIERRMVLLDAGVDHADVPLPSFTTLTT